MDFDRAGGLLSQTMKKLTSLTESERGRSYLLYTAIFFVFILCLLIFRAMF